MSLVHTYKSETFGAEITETNGRKTLKLNSPDYFQNFLNTKLKVGEKITLNLTAKKPRRTVSQNNYLWVYYNQIAEETGHTPEEIHEWAKTKCLPSKIVNVMGDKVRLKTSTTDLTVNEFCEFIQNLEEATGIPAPPTENYGLSPLTMVLKEKLLTKN